MNLIRIAMDTLQYIAPTVKKMILNYFKLPDISSLSKYQQHSFDHQLNLMIKTGMMEKMCLIACELGPNYKFTEKITEYACDHIFRLTCTSYTGVTCVLNASHNELTFTRMAHDNDIKLTIRNADTFDIAKMCEMLKSIREIWDNAPLKLAKVAETCKDDSGDVVFTSYKY